MQADSLTPSRPQQSPWAALLRSKWACLALVAGGLATASSASRANDANLVLGAGVGAVAGAVIGQSVGGRNGAILGAGAGGLVGASIAQQRGSYPVATVPVQPMVGAYPTYPTYPTYPSYRYPAPVSYAPAPAVAVPAPVYMAPQWRPAPPAHHHHHHHHGWGRGYQEPRPFIDGRGDQERLRHERWD